MTQKLLKACCSGSGVCVAYFKVYQWCKALRCKGPQPHVQVLA